MIDSWAATAAGAYSLSENNLYTLEAYQLYFRKLSPRGVVSTSRWLSLGFGFEVQRLLLLVKAALHAEGVYDPMRHVAVIEADKVATVLMSKSPLTDEDIRQLETICEQRGFSLDLPTVEGRTPHRHLTTLLERGAAHFEQQGLSVAAPTDDKPFYFQMVAPFRTAEPSVLKLLGVNADSVRTLRLLMGVMAVLTVLLFFVPFLPNQRARRGPRFWSGSGYFVAIGFGFMLLEMAWLQRCVLYLGHPSLAATTSLGFILMGAGLGSIASRGVSLDLGGRLGFLLPAAAASVHLAMGPIMSSTLGLSLAARIFVVGAMLAPAGFAMGLAFPLGMQAFGDEDRAWFWAMNGSASVLASVLSLALAISFGYLRVGLIGAACYVPAWVLLQNRDRGRGLRRALTALAALPLAVVSCKQIVSLVTVIAARIRFPIALEWMEGGQLLSAERLLEGKPLYDGCGDGYIPFAYPPVHSALLAVATSIFGREFAVGRAVSVVCFACAAALLAREAFHAAGRGARGAYALLAALGWLAASYPVSGAWYDLIRVDSAYLALLVSGMVLSLPRPNARARGRLSVARSVLAALALTGAVFTKQTALLFVPWVLLFALWREWRSGVRLVIMTGVFALGSLGVLNASSGGMFWILVFDVMGQHPLLPELFRSAFFTLLFFAPFGVLIPPMTGWLWLRRSLPVRGAFWSGVALNSVVVSLLTCSKVGAYINNIITAVVFVPLGTIVLGAALLETFPRRSLVRSLVGIAGTAVLGYFCAAQAIFYPAIVPPLSEWRAATALIQFVRDLPGHVLFPANPFIPSRLGKKGPQVHEQGYVDVIGAGLESMDLTTCLSRLDARWLIVNDKTDPRFLELLTVQYEPRDVLPPALRMRVGKYTSPSRLFERRSLVEWTVDRRRRRTIFDFESGSLESWRTTGRAFEPGVTVAKLEYQQPISGHLGHWLVNSYNPSSLDAATGSATSPPFTIDRERLGFRLGGGGSERLRVELVVGGEVVRVTQGVGLGLVEQLVPREWDVRDLRGKEAVLVLRDDDRGHFGHLLVDDVELFDGKP